MIPNRNFSFCIFVVTAVSAAFQAASAADAIEKVADITLFESQEGKGVYRWSEGSTLNLDGEKHLMMVVTAFGQGGHDHTEARILEFHSRDGGVTWTSKEEAKVWQENIGNCNVMSPSLLRLDNGEILGFFMVKEAALRDSGPWVKRSKDNGKTWSEPAQMPFEGYGGAGNDRAVQISTGRVLLPCWVSMDGLDSTHVYVFFSDDRGTTWSKTDLVSVPPWTTGRRTNPAAEEPMILEQEDGRLMMIMRTYLKSIWVSYSDDQGATWSKPVTSGIPAPGSMSTTKRMPNGDVLLIWNWASVEEINGPWPRTFISSAVSKDDGKNFTSIRHLDGAADFEGKITMANVCFSEGNAVITYSKSMTKKNAYNWRLQVIPIEWFYQGDKETVYGESYREELELKTAALRAPSAPSADEIPRPREEQRKAALKKMGDKAAAYRKQDDLVAAYAFDEKEGMFVYDLTGRGNDLALRRVADDPDWADSPEGHSLQFRGHGGMLMAPDSESLDLTTGNFTVEALIYPTAQKKYSAIASKEYVFQVALVDGKLQAAVYSEADRWGSPGWVGTTPVPLNQWTKIGVTFDGRAIRFFLNGKLQDSAGRTARLATNDKPLTVGRITHIAESPFVGRIDELKIWNRVKLGPPLAAAPVDDDFREPAGPRTIGSTPQLFLDEQLIASYAGLERVVNRPVKHHKNPVLTWDRPWEGNCVITWGSILYDPDQGQFQAWYEVYKKYPPPGESGMLLCYATSKDGMAWQKPELGLIEYQGSTANNIVMDSAQHHSGRFDAPTVFRHPNPPAPEKKYLLAWHGRGGVRFSHSADGIRWEHPERAVVASGDRTTAGYDPLRKKFYVITRIPGRGLRTCGLWESDNAEDFEFVREIAAPDEHDPDQTQFYGMIRFPYAGMHLGFLEMFYIPIRKLNAQLLYSHDGHHWYRASDRQTFLDWGPPGSWDQAWVFPSHNPPIRVGDQLYIFYQGRQTLHWAEEPFGHIGSVGLATLRPDGFVSMDSQWTEGTVTTQPVLLKGTTLHVNANAKPGTIRAELLGSDGAAIEGFSRADCRPMEMVDSLDFALTWGRGYNLSAVADTPVRVRFYVQGAKLFSFWSE